MLIWSPRYNPIVKAQHDEADAVQSLARAGHMPPSKEPITPLDMFTALQVSSLGQIVS